MGPTRRTWLVRGSTAGLALLCVGLLVASALAGTTAGELDAPPAGTVISSPVDPAVDRGGSEDSAGLTVVTTQGFYTDVHPGARDVADLLVYDASGDVVYHDTRYDVYFDVDPVAGTRSTIEYVAAERRGGDDCAARQCSLNLVERLNLTTGGVTRVYAAVTPEYDTGRWHDVDRLNATHLVIADIVYDRVVVVDTRTDAVVWQWNASERFPKTAGGGRGDWTHVNDVEVLPDGRIMVGVRNMDSVVFLEPGGGVDAGWTLGADDERDVLYEPHNPDFLPAARGGPAILIADSENNRVLEYHRRDGRWTLAWSWRDGPLQWPRDADRLPNGHTLVVDAHGDRVVEVDTAGAIVWSVDVGRPYDAERLGTGDESATGYAAGTAGRAPPLGRQGAVEGGLVVAVKEALPGRVVNGLLFLAPRWMRVTDLLVVALLLADVGLWAGFEWRQAGRPGVR